MQVIFGNLNYKGRNTMFMNNEELKTEIQLREAKLKELKKEYKKVLKSVKGIMGNETRAAAKNTRKCIKNTEKEIIKAKIQLRLYL
jgi:ElaB/YqjD/DUF883 family membrane-anchored ribosome-binding protein